MLMAKKKLMKVLILLRWPNRIDYCREGRVNYFLTKSIKSFNETLMNIELKR